MHVAFRKMIRLTLLLAIVLGLVGVGFAHRTAVEADPELLAFFEAGGTLADICDESGSQSHSGDRGCDACRLTDNALGAEAIAPSVLASVHGVPVSVPLVVFAGEQSLPLAYGARGPPVV